MLNAVVWVLKFIFLPVAILFTIGLFALFGFIVLDGIINLPKTEAYCKPLENKRPSEFTANDHKKCFSYFHLTNNTYVKAGIH